MSSTASENEFEESVHTNEGTTFAISSIHSSIELNQSACAASNENWISLQQVMTEKKQKTKDLCQQWVKLYITSAASALANFMQLVLRASGNNYNIPDNLQMPLDCTDILVRASTYFENKSISYPFISSKGSAFAHTFNGFVQHLMRHVATTPIILDDLFISNMSNFLMTFSDSKIRAFRHTVTLIALKIMTSLSVLVDLENGKLRDIWLQLFDSVFLKRSRDVAEDIRYLCISECGSWFERYPQSFLDEVQLKYIFQALDDKSPKVCECSLQSLLRLFNIPLLRTACLDLGEEHRATLVDLTLSLEGEVAQLAIQLLIKFHRQKPDVLNDSEIDVIEELVFAANRGVAQAAAEIIPYRFKHATSDKGRVLALVHFFLQYTEHEHAAYLVDSLYGNNEIVLAWSTMVDLLSEPDTLSADESSAIIEILTRGIHQAVTGEIPQGRYTEDLVRQPQPNASKIVTKLLLDKLPRLLRQYRSRNDDLYNLLQLPKHMTFLKPKFQNLLDEIELIMFEQDNKDVLHMGAVALKYLYGLNDKLDKQRMKLLNNAITNFKVAFNNWKQSHSESSQLSIQHTTSRLLVTLNLVSTLSEHFDLTEWNLNDPVLCTLRRAIGIEGDAIEARLPGEALVLYLQIFNLGVYWTLLHVRQLAAANQDVEQASETLRQRVVSVLSICFHLLEHTNDNSLGKTVFIYICEIFVIFSDSLRVKSNGALMNLEYERKKGEYELLEKYLMEHVFENGEPNAIEKLQEPMMFMQKEAMRCLLVAYLKLIFHNIIPMMRSSIVFQHYEDYYPIFGDLMRATLERGLSINCTHLGMTVMHACLLHYKKVISSHETSVEAAKSPEFVKLLKLAKLLAKVFKDKPLEVRQGILIVHRAGICFASRRLPEHATGGAPKNLLYLTVLEQFVPELLAQDLLDVLKFLQGIEQDALPSSSAEEWKPLLSYRSCLELAIRHSCRRDELHTLPRIG